jgi:hypothetical protein
MNMQRARWYTSTSGMGRPLFRGISYPTPLNPNPKTETKTCAAIVGQSWVLETLSSKQGGRKQEHESET